LTILSIVYMCENGCRFPRVRNNSLNVNTLKTKIKMIEEADLTVIGSTLFLKSQVVGLRSTSDRPIAIGIQRE